MSDDNAPESDDQSADKQIDLMDINFLDFWSGQKDIEEFMDFFLGAFEDGEEKAAAKKALEMKFYLFYIAGYSHGRTELLESIEKSLKDEESKHE